MTQAPPSLAQHFAGMAAAMGSMAQARAWRGEVAHALILAWIAAVLGCLTILAAAWEAGRQATHPETRTPRIRRVRVASHGIPTPELRPQPVHLPAFRPAPSRAPPRRAHQPQVPRPSQPPPFVFRASPGPRIPTPYLFRYRNYTKPPPACPPPSLPIRTSAHPEPAAA